MTSLIVVDRSGQEHLLEAMDGRSIMEIVRDSGIDELLALCGGCCSCATCHVYVDEGRASFPPLSDDENDLLDSSSQRTATSRLSCQLIVKGAVAPIKVSIAPAD